MKKMLCEGHTHSSVLPWQTGVSWGDLCLPLRLKICRRGPRVSTGNNPMALGRGDKEQRPSIPFKGKSPISCFLHLGPIP
ncbi:hypothetical protein LEMLEM_LOCUS6364 [Lemmus lemmus]